MDPQAGWTALRDADWTAARDAFAARLDEQPEDPEALDGLGRALWWLGDPREGVERRREAYALYRRRGDTRAAANLATYLAGEHRIAGEPAAASGWLARAERLLEAEGPCAERGWLEIEHAKRAAGTPAERERHALAAAELAGELGDADLEAAALAQRGLALVDAGAVEAGMALLDEAMAAATGEASDPLAIGDTCCTTLVACDRLADFERAAEWCRTVVGFTGRRGYTPLHSWCRTVYAGVLTTMGDWPRAEQELVLALDGYGEGRSDSRAFTLGRLAELRQRQGRLGEAETLLAGHEGHPQAIVASVVLAQSRGEHELACALVARRLDALAGDPVAYASLLPVAIEARLACGDLAAAAEAARPHARARRAAGPAEPRRPRALRRRARGRGGRAAGGRARRARRGRGPLPRARDAARGGPRPARARRGRGRRAGGHARARRAGDLRAARRPPRRRRRRGAPALARVERPQRAADRGRAHRQGAGGARAARRGPLQPGDRRPAVHQPQDRRAPRRAHPRQARAAVAGRGGGVRAARSAASGTNGNCAG